MILTPEKNRDLLGTLVEFAYAEYGSALEMLAAAKKAKSSKLKLGYIKHASDEYRHTALIFKVLSNQIRKGVGDFKREYKFSPQNVILKGYVDKDAYLVEKLSLKKFVEFVYSNEFLAKESFDDLSKRIGDKESLKTINKIMETKNRGGRILAVGTTVVRSLESAVKNGALTAYEGETNIFIYPGYKFNVIDMLLTNFHLSESTLLMLVCAFAGKENVMKAYHHAIKEKYKFYSYGDAMLIMNNNNKS